MCVCGGEADDDASLLMASTSIFKGPGCDCPSSVSHIVRARLQVGMQILSWDAGSLEL